MPIKPENKDRYPSNWDEVRKRILARSDTTGFGAVCECMGECGHEHESGQCRAPHGAWVRRAHADASRYECCLQDEGPDLHWRTPIRIVLTIAHLDHQPENNEPENLRAFCQFCHITYDREHHAESRRKTRDRKSGQLSLDLG